MTESAWERYSNGIDRIKVDGGYIYETPNGLCFVPDIDLQRYQSHLRDAYKKGYADGQEDAKNGVMNADEGLTAYPEDSKQYNPLTFPYNPQPGWRS